MLGQGHGALRDLASHGQAASGSFPADGAAANCLEANYDSTHHPDAQGKTGIRNYARGKPAEQNTTHRKAAKGQRRERHSTRGEETTNGNVSHGDPSLNGFA